MVHRSINHINDYSQMQEDVVIVHPAEIVKEVLRCEYEAQSSEIASLNRLMHCPDREMTREKAEISYKAVSGLSEISRLRNEFRWTLSRFEKASKVG